MNVSIYLACTFDRVGHSLWTFRPFQSVYANSHESSCDVPNNVYRNQRQVCDDQKMQTLRRQLTVGVMHLDGEERGMALLSKEAEIVGSRENKTEM